MNDMSRRSALALGLGTAVTGGVLLAGENEALAGGRGPQRSGHGPVSILLVRHGQTWLNAVDRVQGWSDAALTDAGVTTARTVGRSIARRDGRIDAAYCADMVRHFTTCQGILAGARSVSRSRVGGGVTDPIRVQGLREVAFGGWEGALNGELWTAAAKRAGYSSAQAFQNSGMAVAKMVDVLAGTPAPRADTGTDPGSVPGIIQESSAVVAARMRTAITDIARRHRGQRVLIVSSGLSIVCLLHALGSESGPQVNGAVNTLAYADGRLTVSAVNDGSYATG